MIVATAITRPSLERGLRTACRGDELRVETANEKSRAVKLADENAGSEVRATDLRFSEPGEGAFTARALVGPDGKASEARFQFRGANSPVIPH